MRLYCADMIIIISLNSSDFWKISVINLLMVFSLNYCLMMNLYTKGSKRYNCEIYKVLYSSARQHCFASSVSVIFVFQMVLCTCLKLHRLIQELVPIIHRCQLDSLTELVLCQTHHRNKTQVRHRFHQKLESFAFMCKGHMLNKSFVYYICKKWLCLLWMSYAR